MNTARVATHRIAHTFAALQHARRKALIPYVMAGFPSPAATVPLLHAVVEAGADVIELGIPFSDPVADGPVIQKAAEHSLRLGTHVQGVLESVAAFRLGNQHTPVVLMGYANPMEQFNLRRHGGTLPADPVVYAQPFVQAAAQAGVDGLLIVDYPPQECVGLQRALQAVGMDLIFLLAPTSDAARMAEVGRLASGYVYYVSLTGVTGSTQLNTAAVAQMLPKIREHVHLPIGVGFGISDAASAKAVAAVADAVVIGSRLLALLQAHGGADDSVGRRAVVDFLRQVRAALDSL